MTEGGFQRCIDPDCGRTFDLGEVLFACPSCGSLLDVAYDWSRCAAPQSLGFFDTRLGASHRGGKGIDFSGVWRFRELLPFARAEELVTVGEGQTILQQAEDLGARLGMKPGRLFLQYEGFNPSGSFKDNGMAAAFTMARKLGRRRVGCASTGNTSASMAMYAAHARTLSGLPMEAVVFVGGGKIALGKLAQALDFGAKTLQIEGDFDACMALVQEAASKLDLYLMNSVNPYRLEGQKTIMYRVLQGLGWQVPDWIVVPGGNLGNSSAFGKAFLELRELGLINRLPRLAIINARGADTLSRLVNDEGILEKPERQRECTAKFYEQRKASGFSAKTIASAIEIGFPVNLPKALRALRAMKGAVRAVSDEEILDAKALVGRHGYGCEPASAACVAGLQVLRSEGTISSTDRVVCILTGHALKDPDATVRYHEAGAAACSHRFANRPQRCEASLEAIERALAMEGSKRPCE